MSTIFKNNLKLISIGCILVFLIPFMSFGQSFQANEELTISASPENPEANQVVYLTVISNSPGLENNLITWRKNGVLEKSGVGETKHQVLVGGIGSISTITVSVSRNGAVVSESKELRPAEVALIWEADSYTPPLYKGKALASHQSKVVVVAIPNLRINGGKISAKNLIYEWQLDGKTDRARSGVGKDTFSFSGVLISRPRRVTLLVKTESGIVSARNSINVNFIEPTLLLYKKNPLTGIKDNIALIEGVVDGVESTFVVEPYYISRSSFDGGLINYRWVVDGERLDILNKSKEITFDGDIAGRASVSVDVSNPLKLLQSVRKAFSIIVN